MKNNSMKKMMSLGLVGALTLGMTVVSFADTTSPELINSGSGDLPEIMQPIELPDEIITGTILDIIENEDGSLSYLVVDGQIEILVKTGENSVVDQDLAIGDDVVITFNGIMTMSIPGQITAESMVKVDDIAIPVQLPAIETEDGVAVQLPVVETEEGIAVQLPGEDILKAAMAHEDLIPTLLPVFDIEEAIPVQLPFLDAETLPAILPLLDPEMVIPVQLPAIEIPVLLPAIEIEDGLAVQLPAIETEEGIAVQLPVIDIIDGALANEVIASQLPAIGIPVQLPAEVEDQYEATFTGTIKHIDLVEGVGQILVETEDGVEAIFNIGVDTISAVELETLVVGDEVMIGFNGIMTMSLPGIANAQFITVVAQ